MDELIDILDSDGKLTGKTELKSYAHRMGLFHATVHIWFYTSEGMILLQQRGKDKDIHPLLWDVSVAGHISAGEEIETSALREIQEEIGLTISRNHLEKIGVFKSVQKHRNNLVDCEFHHTFLCELKVPLEDLIKQESEVEDLKLLQLMKFSYAINDHIASKKFVPHYDTYFKTIIKAVKEKL
jgi:isopentenyldiphosphate isomerase